MDQSIRILIVSTAGRVNFVLARLFYVVSSLSNPPTSDPASRSQRGLGYSARVRLLIRWLIANAIALYPAGRPWSRTYRPPPDIYLTKCSVNGRTPQESAEFRERVAPDNIEHQQVRRPVTEVIRDIMIVTVVCL